MKATDLKPVVIGLALLLPAGCAQYYERVVLLPSADGGPGAVTFATRGEKSKAELSRPYDVLEIGYDTVKPGTTTEAEVRQRYGKIVPVSSPPPPPPPPAPPPPPPPKQKTIAVQPPLPKQHLLYFMTGKTEFTPESRAVFEAVRNQLLAMPEANVVVIGHTDRVGSRKRNDALSLKRAQWVRARLIAAGIPKNRIEAVGRGEREPLIPTADGVAEPQNRRVEVRLR